MHGCPAPCTAFFVWVKEFPANDAEGSSSSRPPVQVLKVTVKKRGRVKDLKVQRRQMSGSHCFCVPPVLACVCFFPVLVLVESEHYISILTERRSMRHAHARPSLPLPADQRHAARARESRRLLAAVATAKLQPDRMGYYRGL